MNAKKTLAAIDAAIFEKQDSGFRRHLGASGIGKECGRAIWYSFRWALEVKHKPQTLRIFNRGNLEESRFIKWLTDAGIEVKATDDTGRQFNFAACGGHFGGSCDGFARGIPDLDADEWALLEFKTSNKKNFDQLVLHGVLLAHPTHWAQCQVYMYQFEVSHALYLSICKDNDQIHAEIIEADTEAAKSLHEYAKKIIFSEESPPRIHQEYSWWQCSFCDYKEICKGQELPAINCRTCCHVTPVKGPDWQCEHVTPGDMTTCGDCTACPLHVYHPAVINAEMTDHGESWIEYTFKDGQKLVSGRKS